MTILEKLHAFLLTKVSADTSIKRLDPDEDLIERGIIDSLGIMKLVNFMEEELGLKVEDGEIIPENYSKLSSMVKYVEGKMAEN